MNEWLKFLSSNSKSHGIKTLTIYIPAKSLVKIVLQASINLQVELEGLSTRQALMMLYDEIEAELKVFKSAFSSSRWRLPFQVFRMSNTKSSFHWSSIILLVLCAGFLLVAYGVPVSVGYVNCHSLLLFALLCSIMG